MSTEPETDPAPIDFDKTPEVSTVNQDPESLFPQYHEFQEGVRMVFKWISAFSGCGNKMLTNSIWHASLSL